MDDTYSSDNVDKVVARFEAFKDRHPDVEYIWVEYIDYSAMRRTIMIPIEAFREQLRKQKWTTIFGGLRGQLPNDTLAPGVQPIGEVLLQPDLDTLSPNKAVSSPSATVLTSWMQDSKNDGEVLPVPGCPRRTLQHCCSMLADEHKLSITFGFEIEVCFFRPMIDQESGIITEFRSLPTLHHAYHISYQQLDTLPMIEEIVSSLRDVGISVPDFHAEAAPGQWEFPLPPSEPLKAVDMYYQARSIIGNVARKYGLKAVYYPRPYNTSCGSASHMHFSIETRSDHTSADVQDKFIAGLLGHLESILAFTLSQEESYDRVGASIFGGGEYIAWGTQNREVPLRKCVGKSHWEFRAIDGVGNMYLSAAAVLAAGLCGLRQGTKLELKDCELDPSKMSKVEREAHGIIRKIPDSLEKSLGALEGDGDMSEVLGTELVKQYVNLKRAFVEMLKDMDAEKRRLWLMERY